MRRKYLLFLVIPLALALSGCRGGGDHHYFLDTKTADLILTITPTVVYIGHRTNQKIALRELNGVGVNLDYTEWLHYNESGQLISHDVKTGKEAEEGFDKTFGTHYLIPWGSLFKTRSVLFGPGFLGKHIQTMGGKDNNGNTVRASAEYWVRR